MMPCVVIRSGTYLAQLGDEFARQSAYFDEVANSESKWNDHGHGCCLLYRNKQTLIQNICYSMDLDGC